MARDINGIYSKKRYDLNGAILRAENDDIDAHNRTLILKYIHQHYSKGISEQRCVKLLAILRNLCKMTTRHFDEFTRDDIMKVISTIKSHPTYAPATKEDYVLVLKMFYKWFESEDDRIYADELKTRREVTLFYKFIRETKMRTHRKQVEPSEIITDEDIQKVIGYCNTIRDRALIKLLHETGGRIQEILLLEIKDILFDNAGNGRVLLPDVKTGQRRIPIVYSVPFLRDLIDNHPNKNNPNSRLWWKESDPKKRKPLCYDGARDVIKRVWKKLPSNSPIKKKPCNPHFFRHSRATLLAPHLTAELLCKYMGWTPGSKQAKTYVHLSPEDLDKAFFVKMGIAPDDIKNDIKPQVCSICDTNNIASAEYCMKCGKPLSSERVVLNDIRENKEMESNVEMMKKLFENPDVRKLLEKAA